MESSDPISSLLRHKNHDLWSTAPETTVFEAIELMAEKGIGSLLVMEGDKLVGLITERNYMRDVILKERSSRSTPVREIMTSEPVQVGPSDTVRHCMELMTNRRFRHLPVVSEGKVVGIVSIGDLVKWIISAQEAMIGHLKDFIQGTYPA